METIIIDNFLSKSECNFLIQFYKDNTDKVEKFNDTKVLVLDVNSEGLDFFTPKLNSIAKDYNSTIDYIQIVEWPIKSKKNIHVDNVHDNTTISSITYLNDNYEGGQTFFEEGTIFKPKMGRTLFFDGRHYRHGVKTIEKETRYVVATWYKKLNPSF